MNFNHLVEFVLNENETIKPKLDGEREVYNVFITITDKLSRNFPFTIYDLYRLKHQEQLQEWDNASLISELFYQGHDYNQAYTTFRKVLYSIKRLQSEHDDEISYLLRQARKASQLIGEFKVFRASEYYVFGVEVDVGLTRKIEIHNNLQDIDTSGLEDLL
jgi:hypothetical protein